VLGAGRKRKEATLLPGSSQRAGESATLRMSSVETLSSQEVWVEAKEGYAMGDSSLEREGSTWQQPQKDMDIRREAFIRILTIIERGIGQRSRDKRREHRVSLALETLCYEHARNREEFCDPALFKVLLHRMAAEKAKRRRGRQCSESNYKPLDLSVIGMDSLIIPESAGPRDAFDPSRAMETEGFSFSKTGENERTGQNCSFSSQSQHQQQFASHHQSFRVGGKGGVKVKQEWAQPGNEIDAKQGLRAESAANQMARTSSVSTSSDISNEKTPDKPNRMDRISNLKLELDKDMIKAFDTRFEEHNSSNEFHGAELPLHMPFPGQQFSDLFDATQPMSFEGAHQGNQQQQQQQQQMYSSPQQENSKPLNIGGGLGFAAANCNKPSFDNFDPIMTTQHGHNNAMGAASGDTPRVRAHSENPTGSTLCVDYGNSEFDFHDHYCSPRQRTPRQRATTHSAVLATDFGAVHQEDLDGTARPFLAQWE